MEPKPPPLTGAVRYGSLELVCLHEAGHAAAAILVGARVVEMELYLIPLPAHGRTRIDRDDEQRRVIALGGFAVERRLWEGGRLLLPDGQKPTEKQMLDESAINANVDRISFFGGDHRNSNGYWPKDMDLKFMVAARDLSRVIDLSLVERLAGALLAEKKLDENRIRELM